MVVEKSYKNELLTQYLSQRDTPEFTLETGSCFCTLPEEYLILMISQTTMIELFS